MTVSNIVIVGGGQAGANAILALRSHNYTGDITLISEEKHLPYERPPLSKDAILKPTETKVEILSAQKMAELGVKVLLNTKVERIQPEEHCLVLADNTSIGYDKLLLTTGASPRRIPLLDNLSKHVYTLRNLEDSQALVNVLQPNRHVLLIGGGVIGLELASTANTKGAKVTLIEMGSSLMGRCSPKILSNFLLTKYRQAGIDIRLNTQLTDASLQDDRVVITLDNQETITVDAVIYGIGVTPNTQLAMDADLAVDCAIQVDGNCQTSDPDIYAAGDVATQLQADGQYRRLETWENANNQAATFARSIMNIAHPTNLYPWFWTEQLDMNIQFVGDMSVHD